MTRRPGAPLTAPRSELGQALFDAREAKGLSVLQLSRRTGYDRTSIYNWERGKQLPAPRVLWRLCELLDFDPARLLQLLARAPKTNLRANERT